MAEHYVKLKVDTWRTNDHGERVQCYAGDWIKVRGMELRALLESDRIYQPAEAMDVVFDLSDCGVVTSGNVSDVKGYIRSRFDELDVVRGREIEFSRTLLWNGKIRLDLNLAPVGFHLLTKGWLLAVPLFSYSKLARDIGTKEDRKLTEDLVHDLRVPVYDTGLMYVRRCDETKLLFETWKKELEVGSDEKLAFLRAFYRVKPPLCPLPRTWVQ